MANTGNTTWSAANLYRLGSQSPQDNSCGGSVRMELPSSVAPGATVTFNFNVTAPSAVNTYNFQWRMVQDNVEWFGDYSANVAVKDGINDAAFVSQSVPAAMIPGQSYPVSVTLTNTGTSTWSAGAAYRLGAQNPQDNTVWGLGRVELAAPVAPGGSATFGFNVTAPTAPGSYHFQWRMVQELIEWFGAFSADATVSVQGAPLAKAYYIHTDHPKVLFGQSGLQTGC